MKLSEEKADLNEVAAKEKIEQTQEPQEIPVEQPWSVPGPRIELPETEFEPLRPLEPTVLGEAIAQGFNLPKMPEFEPLLPTVAEGEHHRIPMNRPVATLTGEVCPHGLMGNCVWCQRFPCDYMLKRSLRFLLTMVEYGGERTS